MLLTGILEPPVAYPRISSEGSKIIKNFLEMGELRFTVYGLEQPKCGLELAEYHEWYAMGYRLDLRATRTDRKNWAELMHGIQQCISKETRE